MASPRPKYHFLTVIETNNGKHIVALPYQTFGRKSVKWGVLVKDVKGARVVANARNKASKGDILFTTTLREGNGCLVAKDIYRFGESDNIFMADAVEYYEQYKREHSVKEAPEENP